MAEIALPFPLIAAGEQRVSSSLTAILIACVPLLVALLAIRFDAAERATGVRLRRAADRPRAASSRSSASTSPATTDELIGTALIVLAAVRLRGRPDGPQAQAADLDARASMGGALLIAARRCWRSPPRSRARRETPTGEALARSSSSAWSAPRSRSSSSAS